MQTPCPNSRLLPSPDTRRPPRRKVCLATKWRCIASVIFVREHSERAIANLQQQSRLLDAPAANRRNEAAQFAAAASVGWRPTRRLRFRAPAALRQNEQRRDSDRKSSNISHTHLMHANIRKQKKRGSRALTHLNNSIVNWLVSARHRRVETEKNVAQRREHIEICLTRVQKLQTVKFASWPPHKKST